MSEETDAEGRTELLDGLHRRLVRSFNLANLAHLPVPSVPARA